MTALMLSFMLLGQVLPVDSIVDPGNWTDPANIFASDDLYAATGTLNDNITVQIADPADTTGTIDSVYVYLEQYVDATNGLWNVTPIINGSPGTQTPDIAGTLTDSILGFNVSADIAGWADLFDFQIELTATKGGGATPDWFADHLYVYLFVGGADIHEEAARTGAGFTLSVPTFGTGTLRFAYTLHADSPIYVEIFSISGARVLQKQLQGKSGSHSTVLHAGNLGHGIYFLKAASPSGTRTAKFAVLN